MSDTKFYVAEVLGCTEEEIKELVQSCGLDDSYTDIIGMRMTEAEWSNGKKIIEAMRYRGFDAKQIISQFFKKASEYPRGATDIPSIRYGETYLYEKNDAKTDLLFFINLFLESGNNIRKIKTRVDSRMANVVNRKIAAYGIITDIRTCKSLSSNKLTLARISKAFSIETAYVIISGNVAGKMQSKIFKNVPVLMQHTVFSGLIPSNLTVTNDLRSISLVLDMEMTIMLANPKKKMQMVMKQIGELLDSSERYVDAAIQGGARSPTEENHRRTRILIKGGILVTAEKDIALNDTIKAMVLTAHTVIAHRDKTYPEVIRTVHPEN